MLTYFTKTLKLLFYNPCINYYLSRSIDLLQKIDIYAKNRQANLFNIYRSLNYCLN